MSAELGDWSGPAWLLVMAFTGALAGVALLRRPCRWLFGAESAFLLWSLPPLAMLASQLPHASAGSVGTLSGAAWVVISAAGAWPVAHAADFDWSGTLGWVWLSGALTSLVRATVAQWRYRDALQGATPLTGVSLAWPVLRAATVDTGPALVGAWRPRIVVPADFTMRYAENEQLLILAHEAMHARRHDGWWSLLAQLLASLLWFHPLAWWALAALRRDQELACDAAVLRERGSRRSYALAMLKTPAAMQSLPVGCSWSSHPLTERIAMLKSPSPSSSRRRAGILASLACSLMLSGVVYAASTPEPSAATGQTTGDREYQLDMQISIAGTDAEASHAPGVQVAWCMAPGKTAMVSAHGHRIDAVTRPAGDSRVSVDLRLHGSAGSTPAHLRLEGVAGQPLEASGAMPGGASRYVLEVTPRLGCPARAVAAAGEAGPITMKVEGQAAREVARSIATQAGFVLVNPDALDERRIALEFEQVPATSAMQLVAHADGMRAVFDGSSVRFEPKP